MDSNNKVVKVIPEGGRKPGKGIRIGEMEEFPKIPNIKNILDIDINNYPSIKDLFK